MGYKTHAVLGVDSPNRWKHFRVTEGGLLLKEAGLESPWATPHK